MFLRSQWLVFFLARITFADLRPVCLWIYLFSWCVSDVIYSGFITGLMPFIPACEFAIFFGCCRCCCCCCCHYSLRSDATYLPMYVCDLLVARTNNFHQKKHNDMYTYNRSNVRPFYIVPSMIKRIRFFFSKRRRRRKEATAPAAGRRQGTSGL